MIAWTLAVEFIKRNKWLVVLALLTLLVYLGGNVVVSCMAYLQPKVTVIRTTVYQKETRTLDKTVTKETEVHRPDGTIEMLKLIQNDVRSINTENHADSSSETKAPVAIEGSKAKLTLLPGATYEPIDKKLGLALGMELGILQAGVSHELLQIRPDKVEFVSEFRPVISASVRFGLGM